MKSKSKTNDKFRRKKVKTGKGKKEKAKGKENDIGFLDQHRNIEIKKKVKRVIITCERFKKQKRIIAANLGGLPDRRCYR